jgi:hypothetical protein
LRKFGDWEAGGFWATFDLCSRKKSYAAAMPDLLIAKRPLCGDGISGLILIPWPPVLLAPDLFWPEGGWRFRCKPDVLGEVLR